MSPRNRAERRQQAAQRRRTPVYRQWKRAMKGIRTERESAMALPAEVRRELAR